METRKPGNPGGTRGNHNAPYVSQPKEASNSGASAPKGEVDTPKTPPRTAPRKGHSIR